MKLGTIALALDKAEEKYFAQVAKIANRLFIEEVKPVCDQYNLTFLSGNGEYFFVDKGKIYETSHVSLEADDYRIAAIVPLLEEPMINRQAIGSYMGNYNE